MYLLAVSKLELSESVTLARRGQWPRTPPVYLYERSSGARPPWPRKVSECLEGRTRERDQPRGSIGLNSIWVKLTQRREEQRTLVGEVADERHAGETFHEKHKTWTLFSPLFIYISNGKGPRWIFFPRASGDTTPLTRSWFDKNPKWPSVLGKLTNVLFQWLIYCFLFFAFYSTREVVSY